MNRGHLQDVKVGSQLHLHLQHRTASYLLCGKLNSNVSFRLIGQVWIIFMDVRLGASPMRLNRSQQIWHSAHCAFQVALLVFTSNPCTSFDMPADMPSTVSASTHCPVQARSWLVQGRQQTDHEQFLCFSDSVIAVLLRVSSFKNGHLKRRIWGFRFC
jgi:hypothetical protein